VATTIFIKKKRVKHKKYIISHKILKKDRTCESPVFFKVENKIKIELYR